MNFEGIREQIKQFRKELMDFIESLPMHAEGVTPLNKKGTCAVVSFSTIAKHNNLSADYYLNHTAKEELKRLIERTPLERLDQVIEKILQTGRIPNKPIKMNPTFLGKLKEMWEAVNEKDD